MPCAGAPNSLLPRQTISRYGSSMAVSMSRGRVIAGAAVIWAGVGAGPIAAMALTLRPGATKSSTPCGEGDARLRGHLEHQPAAPPDAVSASGPVGQPGLWWWAPAAAWRHPQRGRQDVSSMVAAFGDRLQTGSGRSNWRLVRIIDGQRRRWACGRSMRWVRASICRRSRPSGLDNLREKRSRNPTRRAVKTYRQST